MEKPKMTKETYEYLEVYLYNLVKFTETLEFLQDTNSQNQLKLMHEISSIGITLNVLKQVLDINEDPVIAWPVDSEEYLIYYRFTNPKIASKALGCRVNNILAVCTGNLPKSNGYYFSWEEDFEPNEVNYNPNINDFKLT